MHKGISSHTTGNTPDREPFPREPETHKFRGRKVVIKEHVNDSPDLLRNSLNLGDTNMVTSNGNDRMLFSLNRKYYYTRKDAARKNLMGYLYSRQPAITRSYSFVAGEKPNNEAFFPRLQTFQKERVTNYSPGPEARTTVRASRERNGQRSIRNASTVDGSTADSISKRNGEQAYDRLDLIETKVALNRKDSSSRIVPISAPLSRPETNKFSLPDLINDLNKEVARNKSSPMLSDEEDSVTPLNNNNLVTFIGKQMAKSGKIYASRHRPITPGLLDKLNRLKQPTKFRTGQWITTLPSDPRAYIGESRINSYKSTAPEPDVQSEGKGWIYEDT